EISMRSMQSTLQCWQYWNNIALMCIDHTTRLTILLTDENAQKHIAMMYNTPLATNVTILAL
ncbi:MAG: hypothetical protein ACKPKO_49365, partial [Candidatus Fonsibacter sp.]